MLCSSIVGAMAVAKLIHKKEVVLLLLRKVFWSSDCFFLQLEQQK